MKILYVISGNTVYGIVESDITDRHDMVIEAEVAFSIQADPSKVVRDLRGQQMMNFIVVKWENVMIQCDFIAEMPEKSEFYEKIREIITKDMAGGN